MMLDENITVALPDWLADDIRHYLLHTGYGVPIRALARQADCHASTVLRQVRKIESRRDDPLLDGGLRELISPKEPGAVPAPLDQIQALRRLAEPGAMLAVAKDMDAGVIVRESKSDTSDRAVPLDLAIARILSLQGWIDPQNPEARVVRYRITPSGRAGLRSLLAETENRAREMAEAPASFEHKGAGQRQQGDGLRSYRLASRESPIHGLARRKDKDGKNFLTRDMVRAAERLREEFEIAHVGAVVTQDWANFLCGGSGRGGRGQSGELSNMDARQRVEHAFAFLGAGLSEVVYRTCCLVEGLEATEKRMGWSARSGKIVLRIALQRLVLHYEDTGQFGPKIG